MAKKYKTVEEWFDKDHLEQKKTLALILKAFNDSDYTHNEVNSKTGDEVKKILKHFAFSVMREAKMEMTTRISITIADMKIGDIGL
jgi:hypothetical protein